MRLLVCGSRNWKDYESILLKVFALTFFVKSSDVVVIDGLAWGADNLGHKAAHHLGFDTLRFSADWKKHGKAAGSIRNQQMLTEGEPDYVLAFPLRGSIGTWDMVQRARERGIEVEVWEG